MHHFFSKSLLKSALMLCVVGSASSALASNLTLAWDPKSSPGVVGYKLYYGTASRTYSPAVNVGNNTTYTVTNLTAGTYYFSVTAHYSTGVETSYSTEVSATISDSPTGQPLPAPTNVTVK